MLVSKGDGIHPAALIARQMGEVCSSLSSSAASCWKLPDPARSHPYRRLIPAPSVDRWTDPSPPMLVISCLSCAALRLIFAAQAPSTGSSADIPRIEHLLQIKKDFIDKVKRLRSKNKKLAKLTFKYKRFAHDAAEQLIAIRHKVAILCHKLGLRGNIYSMNSDVKDISKSHRAVINALEDICAEIDQGREGNLKEVLTTSYYQGEAEQKVARKLGCMQEKIESLQEEVTKMRGDAAERAAKIEEQAARIRKLEEELANLKASRVRRPEPISLMTATRTSQLVGVWPDEVSDDELNIRPDSSTPCPRLDTNSKRSRIWRLPTPSLSPRNKPVPHSYGFLDLQEYRRMSCASKSATNKGTVVRCPHMLPSLSSKRVTPNQSKDGGRPAKRLRTSA
ncbi:hypothetical protein FISHEDRAFT_75219 [Fistulina hepatica ATCC 64428]|uniref:Uncharacterized protein n=1 Tax=Fistulina hepatica ATCC 64428 TaxID=1128425 RepID=A0A0D7A917_9AGAR|nr:hypothetical protein FISHEDRAFT_75219 [Fistulina hepatica ATCC 64428]